ncbi:MAG: glycine/sarcosine/betaine reductase complex component C subunit alpha [Eubacteriales bacterium]|nr:glycine/sarcosine/betaine reductase complex component C subunit alpha [Eubacteriales bacterium]
MPDINKIIASTFNQIANALETGKLSSSNKIAVTGIGSELGEENVFRGAEIAAKQGISVVYIGSMQSKIMECKQATCEADVHTIMNELLKNKEVQGAVTMHYPFPIGVSTVGKLNAVGTGMPFYMATTTGTTATNRVEAMVKNTICGIVAAKASGLTNPTVGIMNIDGARATEGILKKLNENGYPITMATSMRADGGSVLRGNDILNGSADIVVCDSLTGNLFMKTLSAYTTAGKYEVAGFGYGPGIGEGVTEPIMIVSRASGSMVIAGAISYANDLCNGNFAKVVAEEFAKAKKAGLNSLLDAIKEPAQQAPAVKAPPKEVCTEEVAGIDVMALEDAVQALWAEGIYAESGMGCTGPLIMMAEHNKEKAVAILTAKGYMQ